MSINTPKNNFVWYILILVALFVLIFFTKNIFADMQQSMDLKNQRLADMQSNEAELARLNKIQKDFSDNNSDATAEISKFTKGFDDQAIINHIYDYIEKLNAENTVVAIKSVSLWEWKVWDLWFKSLTYPAIWESTSFQTNIPLKLFYK